jgi:MoaA/NifB/PqqE/SkfB family radical SAM enzyme
MWNFDRYLLTEVTDRCNLECPHCYHLPDNKIKDIELDKILQRIKSYPAAVEDIVLAGAESSLRKDIADLIVEISNMNKLPHILTNGVKFADIDFIKQLTATNKNIVIDLGLNHPSYIGNKTIREKQLLGIHNINKNSSMVLGYIGYTMVSLDELDGILNEICFSDLHAMTYRIRSGSEIGRNATDGRIFVSDIVKLVEVWANNQGLDFAIENADNNIYHTVVNVGGKLIRLIHWCDETNIDMEELRSGPWCDFVPDGITNFLHQVIRRDVWKNNKTILPDLPPLRYQIDHFKNTPRIF